MSELRMQMTPTQGGHGPREWPLQTDGMESAPA
jgi:hypothetical protein